MWAARCLASRKASAAPPGCQPSRVPRHEILALQHCAKSSSTSAFTRKDELHGASGGGRARIPESRRRPSHRLSTREAVIAAAQACRDLLNARHISAGNGGPRVLLGRIAGLMAA